MHHDQNQPPRRSTIQLHIIESGRPLHAAGTIRIAKEDSKTNIADMLTKPLSGPRLKDLCSRVLY